jgi:short-subunit dehydrogenase
LAAGVTVDLLVNNAGFASYGPFADEDPDRLAREIQLNCSALVALTARLLPPMLARGRGGVLNVASTAGFQPVPTMAVYGASKAFVLSFTEALWAETRASGVRVLALCPGPTQTRFFETAGNGKEFLTRGRRGAGHPRPACPDTGAAQPRPGALPRHLLRHPGRRAAHAVRTLHISDLRRLP